MIVGIIDTGIDYTHPAFRTKDGKTRILALLDYSLPASEAQDAVAPRRFTQEQIDKALSTQTPLLHRDENGHGTHIAGIAAGNGQLTVGGKQKYIGIAPRADLVVVKALRAGRGEFDSGDVLEAIAFIHQFAKKRNQPYVLNLSLGGHHGGHDGTTLLERAIDGFSGAGKPGQVIVASAGNEGNKHMHTSGWLKKETPGVIQLMIPEYSPSDPPAEARIVIDIWYPYASNLKVTLTSPRGEQIGPFGLTQGTQEPQKLDDGAALVLHQTRFLPPESNHISIILTNTDEVPLRWGTWKIKLEGDTERYDAWLSRNKLPKGRARFAQETVEMLIGVPGASRGVITVGSFNSRSGWLNSFDIENKQNIRLGNFSDFSSPGPTRDGRPKPDILAPGLFIIAPASQFAGIPAGSLATEKEYTVSQGTSQAAPHVTGAVALLLQQNPALDTPSVRTILQRSAITQTPSSTPLFHPRWGFGKLDIYNAIRSLTARSTSPADPNTSTFGSLLTRLPANGLTTTQLYVIPKDETGLPLDAGQTIQIKSSLGTIIAQAEERKPGIYEATFRAPREAGIATLTAWVGSVRLHQQLQIDCVASTGSQQQGCQCTSTSPPSEALWYVLCFYFFLAFWRKTR